MSIKSANQLIYEYYHDISTAELKAYALVQLAYMFYTVYNRGMFSLFAFFSVGRHCCVASAFHLHIWFLFHFPFSGNYRQTAQKLREEYLDRTHQTQDIARHFLEYSKRDIWRCDPNRYTVGTYEEVTNFLQGYLDNEANLNPENSCQSTCEDYTVTENYGCFEDTYCALKPEKERERAICKGKIVNCEFLGSDLNVCSSVSLHIVNAKIPIFYRISINICSFQIVN